MAVGLIDCKDCVNPSRSNKRLDPERAEHKILLFCIWSEVYGLRAELIERKVYRGTKDNTRFTEADEAIKLRLGALLNYFHDYLARCGDCILHGELSTKQKRSSSFWWPGELTEKQAWELRWKVRRRSTNVMTDGG